MKSIGVGIKGWMLFFWGAFVFESIDLEAQSFASGRIEDGCFVVTLEGDDSRYYVIRSAESLAHMFRIEEIVRGEGEKIERIFPIDNLGDTVFYEIEEKMSAVGVAGDFDEDGIPDVYELRFPQFLDPLEPLDAEQDQDRDGVTTRQEYLWGSNPFGPFGTGPVDIRIAAGSGHSMILTPWGELLGWGRNESFQLSNADLDFISFPRLLGPSSRLWRKMFGGGNMVQGFTLAIDEDGYLWGWGDNSSGQLGVGESVQHDPQRLWDFNDWTEIACGGSFALGSRPNAGLWFWGTMSSYEGAVSSTILASDVPMKIADGHWYSLAAGLGHFLAIRSDGTLWAMGDNLGGQLGIGANSDVVEELTRVGDFADWRMVRTTTGSPNAHTFGLRHGGILWGWGNNQDGQVEPQSPLQVIGEPIRNRAGIAWNQVACTERSTVAVRGDGTLWTWGFIGSATSRGPLQKGSSDNWDELESGVEHVVLRGRDNTVWEWAEGDLRQIEFPFDPLSPRDFSYRESLRIDSIAPDIAQPVDLSRRLVLNWSEKIDVAALSEGWLRLDQILHEDGNLLASAPLDDRYTVAFAPDHKATIIEFDPELPPAQLRLTVAQESVRGAFGRSLEFPIRVDFTRSASMEIPVVPGEEFGDLLELDLSGLPDGNFRLSEISLETSVPRGEETEIQVKVYSVSQGDLTLADWTPETLITSIQYSVSPNFSDLVTTMITLGTNNGVHHVGPGSDRIMVTISNSSNSVGLTCYDAPLTGGDGPGYWHRNPGGDWQLDRFLGDIPAHFGLQVKVLNTDTSESHVVYSPSNPKRISFTP